MKKIIISLITIFSFTGMYAQSENNLNIVPFTITSGTSGTSGYFDVSLSNADCQVTALTMDLYMPDGIRIYTNASGNLISSSMALVSDRSTYYNAEEEDNVTAFSSASGQNFKKTGDGVEYYEWAGAGQFPVAGTSGLMFKGRYKLSADVADGVYPIKCVAQLRNADGVGNKDVVSYSYVVVGNPEKASLTVSDELPSYVLDKLNSETCVTNLDLSAVTSTYGTYALVDGRTIVAPEGGLKVDKATYTRTVTGYGSLELPFDAEGGTFYTTKVTAAPADGGYVHFDADTKLAANTAAIIKDETVNVSTTNFTITSVAPKTINTGYYVKSAGIYQVNGSAVINPYRASWDFGSAVKGFTFGDDATGISTVELDENGSIYDLNGRKLNKAGRGVNIINGQKILKK